MNAETLRRTMFVALSDELRRLKAQREGVAADDNVLHHALTDAACRISCEHAAATERALEYVEKKLQFMCDLKDEVYEEEPVSREAADVAARNMGRMAKEALSTLRSARG